MPKDRRGPPQAPTPVPLSREEAHIELQALLKFVGACESGGGAKRAIQAGEVRVNGDVERRRSRKLVPGDTVEHRGKAWVVRGASGS